jgi:hypothetical protein
MARVLALTFVDYNGEEHELKFTLYDSDLVSRWIEITKKNQGIEDQYINARFTNLTYSQLGKVRQRLTDCLNRINSVYDEPLPLYEEIDELTTPELNYLHEEFERYGDRFEELMLNAIWWSQELHEDFLTLNEVIHLHEDLLYVKKDVFPNMALLYDYYPQGLHMPILERDKIWLTPTMMWGEIYLGYNTLGKDWLKVIRDNDIDVVERDQVRPQERFAAETWINFGPDADGIWEYKILEQWYLNLPEELQKKMPIDDLNKLTYGRFKLGQLRINHEFISKYGGDLDGYMSPNSKTKQMWDENVFSTFVELRKIEFYD